MKTTESKRQSSGVLLFLALVSLTSCRKDNPPQIPICITDGLGGADCTDPTDELAVLDPNHPEFHCTHVEGGDGHRYYCPPTKMRNFWATTQTGMAKFSGWCYGAPPDQVQQGLNMAQQHIDGTSSNSPGSKDY